jgi:hypothetical protein
MRLRKPVNRLTFRVPDNFAFNRSSYVSFNFLISKPLGIDSYTYGRSEPQQSVVTYLHLEF